MRLPILFTIPVLRYMIRPVAPRKAGAQGERRGPGALGSASTGNDEINARAIGDDLGRPSRMGGEEPRATFKAPLTVEDAQNSRRIAYPFRKWPAAWARCSCA
jgi:hypothetical protein